MTIVHESTISQGLMSEEKSGKNKIRLAHEIPKKRRRMIEKALADHEREAHPEWDKGAKWGAISFQRKKIEPGTFRTIHFPLLDVSLGNSWPIPVTIIHGKRPGPKVCVIGGIHGDELTGPSACTHLLSPTLLGEDKALDPVSITGTIIVIPVVNAPGYQRKIRYFPDGRDLNRQFPGNPKGSTTRRVADRLWTHIFSDVDGVIDLHSAAKGRTNMPQIRADLAHPESNLLAKTFGIEVILDSEPPKGSLRRTCVDADIPCITFEGGGADTIEHECVQIAINGIINSLRSLKMITGKPRRPKFRLLASGTTWIRSDNGGLLDMHVKCGSIMRENDIIATLADPAHPGKVAEILAPEDGLIISSATNPFITAGMPVAHFLPISKHLGLFVDKIGSDGRFIISGSQDEKIWREELEVDEVKVIGADKINDDGGWIDEWLGEQTSQEMLDHEEEN